MSEEQLIATPGLFGETKNFLLERELGRGGMGGVYMGRDKMLDRPVAVKVMLKEYGDDAAFIEKFKKEAQAAAKLIHPNIAQIYSYGIAEGMPYIAMELVAGGSLDQLMKNAPEGKPDITRVMKIGEQVAQALRCSADQGLVHGDIKPDNVLLDANGNAKIVDFGLAAMQNDTDEIWGTPYYIAPEKVKKAPVDFRADMYSLGGTLYHALTGVAPFEGDDATAVVRARFQGDPKKPSEIRPEISPAIDALIMKMLAREPGDRFPTFEALLEEYKKVLASGMTKSGAAPAAEGAAAGGAKTGGKKLMIKGKKFKVHKPAGESAEDETEDEGTKKPKKLKKSYADEEEEEGGNLGLKVVGVIVGVIVLIGLVIGGLVWFQAADKAAREKEYQEQVLGVFNKAKESLHKTKEHALSFADDVDAMAVEVVKTCEEPTKELRKVLADKYSQRVIDLLKPAPTQELLDAIRLTNTVEEAASPAATNKVEAVAATNAVETAAVAVKAAPKGPKFRAPQGDEADPNSPEGQKYLEEKEKWEAEQKAKEAAGGEGEAQGEGEAPAPKVEDPEETPTIVTEINGLWEKAYGAQAAAIRVRKQVLELAAEAEELDKVVSVADEAAAADFAAKANAIKDRYESIKTSKDVETIQKGKNYIKSRGDKSVKNTVNQLKREKGERERAEKKAAEEAEEKARAEAAAKAKAELIAKETQAAKDKFEDLAAKRVLTTLDWTGAKRQLKALLLDVKTAEGELAVGYQIKKVEAMESAHQILVKNLKGYTFQKSKLKGSTILEVNEKEVKIQLPEKGGSAESGRKTKVIDWAKFFATDERAYTGNLNELINRYIRRGRENCNPKLNLKEWADAMLGTALMMRIVCAGEPTAVGFGEKLAKEAVEKFPTRYKIAKDYMPDADLGEPPADYEE